MENKEKEEIFGKEERTVIRAKLQPAQSEGYDFECVAVPSENRQLKYSYMNDEYFYQVLRTGRENIDVSRMDNGLNLFDNHPFDLSAKNTLGITVGYEFTDEGIVMKCKYGARADEALKSDIKNKVLKNVSIEGDIMTYSIERKQGEVSTYYADLWQPTSLSLAPVPNDIGARIDVQRALDAQIHKKNETFIDLLTKNF
jgi:hypothetical protein